MRWPPYPVHILNYCRIRGLVKDATEVQVQLLTTSEAIEMLCSMAQLDTADNVPAQVMPVVRLCGCLPLCLGIVAGMIRGAAKGHSSTQDCIEEVLTVLQDDKAGALTDEVEFSVSDLVVGRSVRSLPNKDAQGLFMLLGTCAEDALIPRDFVLVLWDSAQPAGSSKSELRMKSSVKLRKTRQILAALVMNNLLHEHDVNYTMHDVSMQL